MSIQTSRPLTFRESPDPSEVRAALQAGRERTLALVHPLSDLDVETAHNSLMSPLSWDLGHIAAYEDLWLVHRHGGEPLLHPELMDEYDAFETPRADRGRIEILNRAEALDYLIAVRERALAVIDRQGLGDGVLYGMVLRHEQQHNETMLQAIEMARFEGYEPVGRAEPPTAPRSGSHTGLEMIEMSAGPFELGADPTRFSFDNERDRHRVEIPAFSIGRTPITNATFLTFVEGGGYERRTLWSDEGWAWKEEYDIGRPAGWSADGREWRATGWETLDPDRPVVHVSWFEADAFARFVEARLPTEAEWEKAATWDQGTSTKRLFPWGDTLPEPHHANLGQTVFGPAAAGALEAGVSPCGTLGMIGDVWEWTGSSFDGYPGFEAHPYREYSQPFFGAGYKVLRGGSWATGRRTATCTIRNWDFPVRRQIFSGLRVARDA